MPAQIVTTSQAVQAVRAGEFLIVVDDVGDRSTGDLIVAAEHADAAAVNLMLQHARGTLCVALTRERLDELAIPPLLSDRDRGQGPSFHSTVDARLGSGTGDSAPERAETIRRLVDPGTRPGDLVRPGHVQTVCAAPGGVLQRVGHTEAAVDLARLAGLRPAAVTATILDPEGAPATMPYLEGLAAAHGFKIASIAELVEYRRATERLVERRAEASLPTRWGEFQIAIYTCVLDGVDYIAIYQGDLRRCPAPLVRVHSGCVTGDILGSLKCDCGQQLQRALEMIAAEGCGVVVYIPSHEGRGIGLVNKIRAYHLQDEGYDTVEANAALGFPADLRDYGSGAQVLADLGITRMRLMTNNPAKYVALRGFGLDIVERVPLQVCPTPQNRRYLETKRDKLGHLIEAGMEASSADAGPLPAGLRESHAPDH